MVSRTDHSYWESVDNIANAIMSLINDNKKGLTTISAAARDTAAKAAWTYFIDYYIEAFDKAFESRDKRMKK